MAKKNCTRASCKDVFRAFLVKNAHYEGYQEMPVIAESKIKPVIGDKFIAFSKCISSKEYDSWVHFYEDDYQFERLWNNPKKYLPILKKFKGIITPDFSIYRDMPLPMQEWNTYRGRALGHWLQSQGINVVCNIRCGDQRTYDFCCNGVPHNSIIAIGSHGNLKGKEDRKYFAEGLDFTLDTLSPETIIVYGETPKDIFEKCRKNGVEIIKVTSDYALTRDTR